MRCSPCSFSPVPCRCRRRVSCSGMRLNRRGDDTAPCRTPLLTCHSLSGIPFRISLLVSLVYISCSRATTSGGYSYLLKISKSWFLLILSKAFRRSMKHACTFFPSSFCSCTSYSITNAQVVQEWYFRNPAQFGEMMLFVSVCSKSFSQISLSITFVQMLVSDIGLCCTGSSGFVGSLGMRNTFAVSHSLRYLLQVPDQFYQVYSHSECDSLAVLQKFSCELVWSWCLPHRQVVYDVLNL